MDSEVYIKACELAQAIVQSTEANELRKAEQRIREDKVANNLAERWKKVYERITNLQNNGQPLTESDERSIEFIEAKVENHPLILDFIEAHHKFTNMLEEVNSILSSALTLENKECGTDHCVTCPSKKQCSTEPQNYSS
ncbi:MAG TPA: YlbF family regulator [Peptococcaceae bacterium]|nr:YlbF family regulator [Peptococcaceae bacterium]